MFGKNVVHWTSNMLSYSTKGLYNKALTLFINMQRANVEPIDTNYSTIVTTCAKSGHKSFGSTLHGLILKKGYPNQFFISSGLISMYSKFGSVGNARKVFDEMSERDECVWNSMISGYAQNGVGERACGLFCEMVRSFAGFVSDFTLATVINACGNVGLCVLGESVHCYAVKVGFDSDEFVGSALVSMYSKVDELGSARRVFDMLGGMDTVVWNTMISGYVQNGYDEAAIGLFLEMIVRGVTPSYSTFSSVIDASSVMLDGAVGRYLHAKSLKFGFVVDVYIGTALVDMYSKCLIMDDAERAFFEMYKKNVVTYNALISGYGLIGDHGKALRIYTSLRIQGIKPDYCTFIGVFTCVATAGAVVEGMQLHSLSIKLGINRCDLVGNSVVNFYSKCGLVDCALRAFETLQGSDVLSWTSIISGLVQNDECTKALEVFCEMHRLSRKVDEFSSSSVIKAVASMASVAQGRHLHCCMIKVGLVHLIFVGSALVDMYSKCGVIRDADRLFREMPEKNAVSWNSMITGYAQNGFSNEALILFREMERCRVSLDSVTFVGVLLACCHAGLVGEGKHYYQLMKCHYGILPSVEHDTCMVNLLSRAGYVDEAEEFLLSSPYKEEYVIWKSLLSSCEAQRDFDVAARVAEHCLRLNPDDSSTYTILSNIYAAKHLWSEVGRTRDLMKVADTKKEPAYSWIQVSS